MTEDKLPSIDWNNPIPGNPDGLRGEIERIRELSDRCGEAADRLRDLHMEDWHGEAAERFNSFAPEQIRLWETAEDEHGRWAAALEKYRETLLTSQQLAKSSVERARQDGSWGRAEAEIDRWRLQVSGEARLAAAELKDVAVKLWSLPLLLPEQDIVPAVVPVAAVGPLLPEPRKPPEHQGSVIVEPDPVRLALDLEKDRVNSLCDAILDAEFVSAEHH